MKKCPFCAEEIQDEAIVCRYCNRDLQPGPPAPQLSSQPPAPQPTASTNVSPGAAIIIVIVLAVVIFGVMGSSRSCTRGSSSPLASSVSAPPAPPVIQPPAPTGPQLEILSSRGTTGDYGFSKVEGRVKNISNVSLENVTAVVTWYTSGGEFITTHDALIDYNPILPGQTSPFSVPGTSNPQMKSFGLEFKYLMGGTIETRDSSK